MSHSKDKKGVKRTLGLTLGLSSAIMASSIMAANKPTLNIFSTQVIDNIRQTTEVAENMETGMATVLTKLESSQKLYEESKCEADSTGQGCRDLRTQITRNYQGMLNIMAEELPKMEKISNETIKILEKKMRSELGHKRTAADLQALLMENGDSKKIMERRRRQATGGRQRMSDRFRQYSVLVSSNSGGASMAVLAADFYIDMNEVSSILAHTQQEITRSQLMGELELAMGGMTPEMMGTVESVKRIIYGDGGEMGDLPEPLDYELELEGENYDDMTL